MLFGWCLGGTGTLLGRSTRNPPESRGHSPVFGEGFWVMDSPSVTNRFAYIEHF